MEYFLLLSKLVVRFLFFFRQLSPLLAEHLVDSSRFLDDTLFHYFWSSFLHIDHEGIEWLLDVLVPLLLVVVLFCVVIIAFIWRCMMVVLVIVMMMMVMVVLVLVVACRCG